MKPKVYYQHLVFHLEGNTNMAKKCMTEREIKRRKMVDKFKTKRAELNEIIKGDSLFCASGITSNEVLKGIVIKEEKFITETLVTHKSSNLKEIVRSINKINE